MRLRRAIAIAAARRWAGPLGARALDDRKPVAVELFLRWAYRQELCKVECEGGPMSFASSSSAIARLGAYGTSIDESPVNQYGMAPIGRPGLEPHGDAVLAGNLVAELGAFEMEAPDDWTCLQDMPILCDHAAGMMQEGLRRSMTIVDDKPRLKTSAATLLYRHALLGDVPVWQADAPELKTISANGKERWFVKRIVDDGIGGTFEAEFDGYNRKAKRPYPGAYRKALWEPDPVEAVLARVDYAVWHAALGVLVDELNPVLQAHRLLPTGHPAEPWLLDL